MYAMGRSERVLGELVQRARLEQNGSTAAPVLATKFAPTPWRFRPTSLVKALRASLRRLGVPVVDLYQMHFPGGAVSIERWMEAMADAVEEGLVRAVGVSNYDATQMRRAHAALARRGVPLASNQIQYSLLHRVPERDGVLAACRELDVTPIAYMPLYMGVLTGKYTAENRPKGIFRQFLEHTRPAGLTRVQPLLSLMREVGAAHGGKGPAQVALSWLVSKGAVPISGARSGGGARVEPDGAGRGGARRGERRPLLGERAAPDCAPRSSRGVHHLVQQRGVARDAEAGEAVAVRLAVGAVRFPERDERFGGPALGLKHRRVTLRALGLACE